MKTATQAFAVTLAGRIGLTLALAGVTAFQAGASETAAAAPKPAVASAPAAEARRADFKDSSPSAEVRGLADWILDADNNRRLPFVIIDKKEARAFAFHPHGELRGVAPVLLGMAIGDDSAPGIGERALSAIAPAERTTPAGCFVAALDRNLDGVDILWVDYDAAISLHRVVKGKPAESRAQRLSSPTSADNRISFGCINVPANFYDRVIRPAFKGTNGIVYVLPETRTAHEVFGSYDVDQRRRQQAAERSSPGVSSDIRTRAHQ